MTLLNYERARNRIRYFKFSISENWNENIKSKSFDINIKKWLGKQLMARRLASFVVVSAMLPSVISPVALTSQTVEKDDYEAHLSFNVAKSNLLSSEKKISAITPGESRVEREAREKAEAEAKIRAEAEAKARAQAQVARNTVSRERRVYSDPSNFDEIYTRAQAASGVDARLLKAIHQVETGGSGSTSRSSYMGAQGPMQFLPSTWRRHAVDGNGDGNADITNVEDAIFSAAAYLKACGYPDVKKALWGYNPSTSYYNKVMSRAHSYGM